MKYIEIFGRSDRLGSNIVSYISQILFALKNNYYIKFNPRLNYYNSIFIECLFNFIINYNKKFTFIELTNKIDIRNDYKHDIMYNMGRSVTDIKYDLIYYFKTYVYEYIKKEFNNSALSKKYIIPFNPRKTILVHLRLDDVKDRNDYNGEICSNYYRDRINNNEDCALNWDWFYTSTRNCQAPLSNNKVQQQINNALIKYPGYEVIIITSPGSNITLPYKCIRSNDENYDLYLLCSSDVIILARSMFSLSALFYGEHKEVYIPLWGHFVCSGLYTKYDKCNYNYFF